ncbi:pyridoxamine 5'-phosphate oxidase family protein [Paenisporosarcina sp. TG20]|uniref:pyridoxamine 5'-phosphate oxidase family protein n=1 Tax=Paenisporosarcina sp. TG20 TaxID=1211706 RepID=UPI0002F4D1B6|nr:pyridoxamine 5'-phosphate oxidase family protein [Paenisporosarcina sp. TG20]
MSKKQALKILEESHIGTMATVENNKPHSRYMTFFNKDFTLYTPTNKNTHKIEDIEANPYTHILIGYEGEGFGDLFLEIEGKVSESQDDTLKEKIWEDNMKNWFEGPEDPKLVILVVEPTMIRLMNKSGEPPEIIEFQ